MTDFPATDFDAIALEAVSCLESTFGLDATLVKASDATRTLTRVMPLQSIEPLGEYGERSGRVYTIECRASDGAEIGDEWELPDGSIWRADALIDDNGVMQKFSIVRESAP